MTTADEQVTISGNWAGSLSLTHHFGLMTVVMQVSMSLGSSPVLPIPAGWSSCRTWLCTTCGATDDFGHKAIENVVNHFDCHATLLHLFDLDPQRLTDLRNGQDQSLLDGQDGRIVKTILTDA